MPTMKSRTGGIMVPLYTALVWISSTICNLRCLKKGHQIIGVYPEERDEEGEKSQGQYWVSEVSWLAPLGEEKAEGGAGSKVHFPHGWQRRGGADLLSLMTSGRTQGSGMKLHWGNSDLALGTGSLLRRDSQSLEQASYSTKPLRVQGISDGCSWSCSLFSMVMWSRRSCTLWTLWVLSNLKGQC